MWIDILKAFLALGILGLIFGGALSIAGNIFFVKEDFLHPFFLVRRQFLFV